MRSQTRCCDSHTCKQGARTYDHQLHLSSSDALQACCEGALTRATQKSATSFRDNTWSSYADFEVCAALVRVAVFKCYNCLVNCVAGTNKDIVCGEWPMALQKRSDDVRLQKFLEASPMERAMIAKDLPTDSSGDLNVFVANGLTWLSADFFESISQCVKNRLFWTFMKDYFNWADETMLAKSKN
jgi:hypothetical protein